MAALEVNISCPNVANRGLVFACDPGASREVVAAVVERTPAGVPVLAKLSPDVTDVVAIAAACLEAGPTASCAINTLLGLVVDTDTLRPAAGAASPAGCPGRRSGPSPSGCVWQLVAAMRAGALPTVPVVGIGGVRTGLDALQFLAAGASAVQVGTAVFNDPSACARVVRELGDALAARGIARVADVVGVAHTPRSTP